MTAKPGLQPRFKASVHDYVSRCRSGRRLALRIRAGSGTVSVNGGPRRRGRFTVRRRARTGQRFVVVSRARGRKAVYHVRCLPPRFPRWTAKRRGRTQAGFYILTPNGPGVSRFVSMHDENGVPIWWRRDSTSPFDASLLPNGNVIWSRYYTQDILGFRRSQAYEEHTLTGRQVRTIKTVGTPTDFHDLQRLPNGNSLVISYKPRKNVDLREYGGPRRAEVLDGVVQELTPGGRVAWSWNSKNHISPEEQGPELQKPVKLADGRKVYDLVHLNSIEPHGDGRLLISARATNALYDIDRRTKRIVWKLGGTETPELIRATNEPHAGPQLFGGQHDARFYTRDTFTVYDNATGLKRPPRAVRYRLDERAGTAERLDFVSDPAAPRSNFAGSARKLAGGNWVVSWGGTPVISELTPARRVAFRLRLRKGWFSYRVFPVPRGAVTKRRLRRTMDAIYRRSRR